MTIKSITQNELLKLFEYCDGVLYWKVSKGKAKVGSKAGYLNQIGYFQTQVSGKLYLSHRLIFLMHHGYLPQYLDHIDGNTLNNKIENLRTATLTQNQYNRKLNKNNSSGVKGVWWRKDIKKWRVSFKINGKEKSFGVFNNLELAELVAQEARTKYHGSFANHG